VQEYDFHPRDEEGQPKPPRVHLLYRPGHYDVVYERSESASAGTMVHASPLRNEPFVRITCSGTGGPGSSSSSIPIGLASSSRVPLSPRARIADAVVGIIASPDTPDSNAGNASQNSSDVDKVICAEAGKNSSTRCSIS
jgi:hypothetical protein